MKYQAPANDLRFLLFDVLGVDRLHELEKYADATPDLILAVIDEAGKLAAEVIQPTNQAGDREGCHYDPQTHAVKTPEGFKHAYKKLVDGGWTSLDAPVEFGGQGLPHTLKFVVDEMLCSTNLSLGMYPGLTHGAISALHAHGSDELKQTYLEKLVSGEWTGTMCLTESQCGTDLGLIRTRATPNADGSYAIDGTKIWITGGEHDLTNNIVHLVLAKLPGAPDTTKGINLFANASQQWCCPMFQADNNQKSLLPFATGKSGVTNATAPTSVCTPVTRHSDTNGPICLGGKLVTASTCLPLSVSLSYSSVSCALDLRTPTSGPKSTFNL